MAAPDTNIPELEPLLRRFADALAVVASGLAPLVADSAADAGPAPVAAAGASPAALARAAELAGLLATNDTRAEAVIAAMLASSPGVAPAWLAATARAIDELDYERALTMLREAGVIAPGAAGGASTAE